jgi:hypothetical protein
MRNHTLNPATNPASASDYEATLGELFDKLDSLWLHQDALHDVLGPELETPKQEALTYAIREIATHAQNLYINLYDCTKLMIERLQSLEVAHF